MSATAHAPTRPRDLLATGASHLADPCGWDLRFAGLTHLHAEHGRVHLTVDATDLLITAFSALAAEAPEVGLLDELRHAAAFVADPMSLREQLADDGDCTLEHASMIARGQQDEAFRALAHHLGLDLTVTVSIPPAAARSLAARLLHAADLAITTERAA